MAGGMDLHFFGLYLAKSAPSAEFQGFLWKFRPLISDSGEWPFHTPPIHTPTKGRPNLRWSFGGKCF